jgi:hypothetical protein
LDARPEQPPKGAVQVDDRRESPVCPNLIEICCVGIAAGTGVSNDSSVSTCLRPVAVAESHETSGGCGRVRRADLCE